MNKRGASGSFPTNRQISSFCLNVFDTKIESKLVEKFFCMIFRNTHFGWSVPAKLTHPS